MITFEIEIDGMDLIAEISPVNDSEDFTIDNLYDGDLEHELDLDMFELIMDENGDAIKEDIEEQYETIREDSILSNAGIY